MLKVHTDIAVRQFIYSLIEPSKSGSILDLGCGNGHDLNQLSQLASENTRLVGIDSSNNIDSWKTNRNENIEFIAADVTNGIPFFDNSFDVVFSKNVIECVTDKQALLKEISRVLRPGGKVVCAHYDWDSLTIDGDEKDLVRGLVHNFGDWKQAWMTDCDAWMGRRLWRTFNSSGLFKGSVHTKVLTETEFTPDTYGWETINSFRSLIRLGKVSEAEFQRFHDQIVELAERGEYFFAVTMFVYVGQRV